MNRSKEAFINIIEALKSGKPFRRPTYDDWIIQNPDRKDIKDGTTRRYKRTLGVPEQPGSFMWMKDSVPVSFQKSALIAENWEILETNNKEHK